MNRYLAQTPVIIILLGYLLLSADVRAQIVLSEVMFDVPGSDDHDEFVEFVNRSTFESVDLTGWRISDGGATDDLLAHTAGMVLGPGQFCVILDASYFANSTQYATLIPASSLIITLDDAAFGRSGLANSVSKTITLLDSTGRTVAGYTYSTGNIAGFSDEKIDLDGTDDSGNWADSRQLFGTPGAPNSVSPHGYDLAVSGGLGFSPEMVEAGTGVEVVATVKNIGRSTASLFSVSFFEDFNADGVPQAEELLSSPVANNNEVAPGDSIDAGVALAGFAAGSHIILVEVTFAADQDLSNNRGSAILNVAFPVHALHINEIMYAPLSGQAEWVELVNLTSETVNVFGWSLSDQGSGSVARVNADFNVAPNDYVVLAQDSSLGQLTPPFGTFVVTGSWPSLNNAGDAVILFGPTGRTIDSLYYRSDWGGDTGISLEKISPALLATDSTNWSSSVSDAGGTPGAQNSIFTEMLAPRATVSVAPNPVSPDGDGRDDFALIAYSLPVTTAQINVKIYDLRGRLIRFLANNRPSGAEGTLVWDGRDDFGQLARMGIYVVFLQAINAANGVLAGNKTTVVLAGKL